MKNILFILLIISMLIACNSRKTEVKKELRAENNAQVDSASLIKDSVLFSDKELSSFEILEGNKETGFYTYQVVEVSYKVVYIALHGRKELDHYLAKYVTTTNTCTACEGQERNIKVYISALKEPENIVMTTDKNCDKLDLNSHTYKTSVFGCCGDVNEYEILDYNHNVIIQAHDKIILGEIPNSKIKIYVGFTSDFSSDSTCLGTLFYAYNGSEKHAIKVLRKNGSKNIFELRDPKIEIKSSSEKDKFSDGGYMQEYTFWSLNYLKDKSEISSIAIRLTFYGDTPTTVEIPIINGVPFGKNEREQQVYIDE